MRLNDILSFQSLQTNSGQKMVYCHSRFFKLTEARAWYTVITDSTKQKGSLQIPENDRLQTLKLTECQQSSNIVVTDSTKQNGI